MEMKAVTATDGWGRTRYRTLTSTPRTLIRERKLYQDGDTWFRDMRAPGFNGGLVNNADNSLPWLGQRMADDPRFATAAVKFWWPAVMGADAALAPEEVSDSDYSERLALFEEQNGFIEALGQQFSQGINGGKPFNGKDLLTEMMLSPWFTAAGIEDGVTSTPAAIGNIGARRLLTPEELEAKSYSLLGRRWGEDGGSNPTYKYDRLITKLLDVYQVLRRNRLERHLGKNQVNDCNYGQHRLKGKP